MVFCGRVLGQITVSGIITDDESGEPMIGATVFDTISRTGVVANEYGFYSLTISDYNAVIRVSSFGYERQLFPLSEGITKLDIALKSVSQELEEFTVEAETIDKSVEQTNSGKMEISMTHIEKLPVFLGERDVLKMLQLLPGVSSGGEGTSGMYVRGGGPDQNLTLLDGVPVYNASHLFGIFSVFNGDAISNVTMYKGGIPSRFGGRASSILDMRMKEGNVKKYNVEGSLGLISSNLLVEGPIVKDKTAFIISARRTYLDVLMRPFVRRQTGGGTAGYYFYDLNAKVHHKLNDKHHLYLSGYLGDDKFHLRKGAASTPTASYYDGELSWGNKIAALRWNYSIGPKLFMNTTATYSKYQMYIGVESREVDVFGSQSNSLEVFDFGYKSNIEDITGKVDFSYVPNPKNYIRFGAGNIYHVFRPGVHGVKLDLNGQTLVDEKFESRKQAHEAFAFIENDHQLSDRFKLNYGLHLGSFFLAKRNYNILQPRLSGNVLVADNSSVKFSYCRMAQYVHLLTSTSIGLPTDLWVPVTEKIRPITSNIVSLGFNQMFGKKYNITLEGYYKTMSNLIQYKEGVSSIQLSDAGWEDKVAVGKGWSYGVELFAEKKLGNVTGWVGYTLSWSTRQFDEINLGKPFPFAYDRRHDIGIAASYQINDLWDVGVVFVLNTGRAFTLGLQKYNSLADDVLADDFNQYQTGANPNLNPVTLEHVESVNGYRMPMYHRMDIGFNRTKETRWGKSIWSFSAYNIYNRQNPFMLVTEDGKLMQLSLFPIIPAVSWKFKLNKIN